MVNATDIWAAGIQDLNEDAFETDEPGSDASWNQGDEPDDDDSFDEAALDLELETIYESGDDIIGYDPKTSEAEPQYPAENDAFKNDPTKDDGVPDLMKDDNSVAEVEMEAADIDLETSLW